MAIIDGWLPPTRAHYDLILRVWQFAFPPVRNALLSCSSFLPHFSYALFSFSVLSCPSHAPAPPSLCVTTMMNPKG